MSRASLALLLGVAFALVPSARGDDRDGDGECDCETYDEDSPARPSFGGVLVPRGPTRVSLASVEVEAVRSEPPSSGSIRFLVRHRVRNPGAATELPVAIRVAWQWGGAGSRTAPATIPAQFDPQAVFWDGSTRVTCAVRAAEWRPMSPLVGTADDVEAWCEARLRFPAGDSERTIAYETLPSNGGAYLRRLAFPLDGVSAWGGSPELHVTLPLALVPGVPVVLGPAGARVVDGAVRWTLAASDVAGPAPALVTHEQARSDARAGEARLARKGPTAAASSTLAPQGRRRYDAALAVDGDATTAWCEGAAGAGVGEWLEVRLGAGDEAQVDCVLEGLSLVPGYGRSRKAWTENGRLRRLRLASCARPETFTDLELDPDSRLGDRRIRDDPSALAVGLRDLGPLASERECFRLTVLDVFPGKHPDTCVGELLPILSCRPRAGR